MAKNFVQEGRVLSVAAPYAVTSGQGVQVGLLFGVAQFSAAITLAVEIDTQGVYTLEKATGAAWAVGDPIYWDNSARKCTKTSTANDWIGVATVAAASGDTTGTLRLNGHPIADPQASSV